MCFPMRRKRTIFWNIANVVTLGRIILLFITTYLMFQGFVQKVVAFYLVMVIIFMDYLDGYLARKFKVASEFGSVFDITGDRIIENVLWIVFAYLKLIPLWIPLVIITRGFLTDGIRSFALSKGMTPFGEATMMRGPIGKMIVSSKASRFAYAAFKFISFTLLVGIMIIKDLSFSPEMILMYSNITMTTVYLTVAYCIIRGIPVIYDGRKLFINH